MTPKLFIVNLSYKNICRGVFPCPSAVITDRLYGDGLPLVYVIDYAIDFHIESMSGRKINIPINKKIPLRHEGEAGYA